ncbi:MAG: winged helix-turn-helix domain-containing protein [Chloroflexi bacterium]|nr:winged helix-turn-helix domain-containing protein [Chloroflexota bacterium]
MASAAQRGNGGRSRRGAGQLLLPAPDTGARRRATWPNCTCCPRAFIKQLRAKLGDPAADPARICNVRGVGYRMPRPGEAGGP